MKLVTSRDNPTYKRLRRIAQEARQREAEGVTLLDGVHLIQAYLAQVGQPIRFIVSESGMQHPEVAALLQASPETECLIFGYALFRELSPVETPVGILAEIAIPKPETVVPTNSCLLLDAVQDAGNLGTLLRTAAAAGIEDILLGVGCARAWSPRVLRAAMGSHFSLRIQEHADLNATLSAFKGLRICTLLQAEKSLYDLDLREPVAWVFGNEGAGLSPELIAQATDCVRIPMPGQTESLNVAAAAAVCLFEAVRQKTA